MSLLHKDMGKRMKLATYWRSFRVALLRDVVLPVLLRPFHMIRVTASMPWDILTSTWKALQIVSLKGDLTRLQKSVKISYNRTESPAVCLDTLENQNKDTSNFFSECHDMHLTFQNQICTSVYLPSCFDFHIGCISLGSSWWLFRKVKIKW